MRMFRLWLAIVLAALCPPPARAADALSLFVASRSYDVSIAPVDAESANADSSVLYQRSAPDEEWTAIGPCRKETLPNGGVRFIRAVDVDRDGTFYYTSRPVVGGDVAAPPQPDSAAQAVVTVDTLPPTAELLAPAAEFTIAPAEIVSVAWVVSDENLDAAPAALAYSGDGGKSWHEIAAGLPPEGDFAWAPPGELAGPALLRLAAIDKANNVGRALRPFAALAPEPKSATEEVVARTPVAEEPVVTRTLEDPAKAPRDPNRSWLYYLMALNLMRQNKPADALQYYWLSVKADPEFINAWADIALAYNELGAHRTAREVVEETRLRAPERIDLLHLLGETYHAEGMARLAKAASAEDRLEAKGAIDQAVAWYGAALAAAEEEWRLAEMAGAFYRLGEICYYVNLDKDGARAYWEKILSLHVPTPNSDLLRWSKSGNKAFERRSLERNTDQWVVLATWQNWARGYLEQLDARERLGILDMMKVQSVRRTTSTPSLAYAGNEMNPGREDGRSLFSLPGQTGSPAGVATASAVAGPAGSGAGIGGETDINFPAHMRRPALADGYAFYGTDGRPGQPGRQPGRAAAAPGLISGRAAPAPREIPDPYAFPVGNSGRAAWTEAQPYGNAPVSDW